MASLERMRDTDFVGYILTRLRNAGLGDDRDREEAAHDVVVQLLVSPGQLFGGYDPDESGRWKRGSPCRSGTRC